MNKIGFRIYRFKEGPSIGLTANEGDWTKKVVDIRDILKLYNSEDESKFAMFMSFSETGAYITIARSISGRGGDNTAAWIYIPNSIEVTDSEIIPIIEVVKEELSASKSNVERLSQLFAKEYRTIEATDFLPSSSEKVYAKRDVGFYPLKEIIGEKRYQPIYSNYNVILINDKDGMEITDKSVVDISTDLMDETLVFCPPVKQDIPKGVTVHFNTSGHPLFNKPVRVYKSKRIEILFKRHGFESISYMTSVEENDQICGIPNFDWKLFISRSKFRIRTAHNPEKDITGEANISINGNKLIGNQVILLSEMDAENAVISISANGYEPQERKVNLLNATNPITFELHRTERTQTWEIELSNGQFAEMTLKSKYLTQGYYNSPLKGYSVGERNQLEYTNFGVLKQRAIGFLIAIATFIVIVICAALYGWYDNHSFEWQMGWPPVKVEKIGSHKNISDSPTENEEPDNISAQSSSDNVSSLSKAISYLDNPTGVWQRDSLISYSELEGLFEELNTYEFDKILDRDSVLKDSECFKEICTAIKNNKDKPFKGKFCVDGDYSITVSKYVDKLNKPVEQSSSSTGSGVTRDAAQKAQKGTTQKASSNSQSPSTDKKTKPKRGDVID